MQQPPRRSLALLPTPLHLLERFPTGFQRPRIWIKRDDLTGAALSGNKVRKLEFCVGDALEQKSDVLITCGGSQSNLCRAVALVGAQLGLRVHLALRGEPTEHPDGNLFLAQLAGAAVTYVSAEDYRSRIWPVMNEIAARYASDGHRPYAMGPGASNEVGLWGYLMAAEELRTDFETHGISPGALIVATGTTSTVSGLLLGTRVFGLRAEVLGITVGGAGATLETKVVKDLVRWQTRYDPGQSVEGLQARILDGYVGPGYGRAEPHIYALIAQMARTEGILLDPVYTAKAFHGLLEETRRGRFDGCDDIVFVHTGGLFGLFPHRNDFDFR
jgi:D-cysteine desulfhydrase